MNIPNYSNIVIKFFNELNGILNHYIFNSYTTIAQHLKYPLAVSIILFITLIGIGVTQGRIQVSVQNFINSAVRIGLIYTFAMNWGVFSEWIVLGIEKSAEQVGDWFMLANPLTIPHFAGEGLYGGIQSVLIEFTKVGAWCWRMGSLHVIGPYFTALMIWAFGYLLIAVAMFQLILAKIMLALLFATAPLFISFTLFSVTLSFFDRWLGSIVGFAFVLLFISGMLVLVLHIAHWAVGGLFASRAMHISLVSFVPLMLVSFVSIGMLFTVAHIARDIGQSATLLSQTSQLASRVRRVAGGPFYISKNIVNRVNTLRHQIRKGEA